MTYEIPVYFADGAKEIFKVSEEYFNENELYIGTNLEQTIEDVYGTQVTHIGYPRLSQAEGEDSLRTNESEEVK